jgi:adenylate cyclase
VQKKIVVLFLILFPLLIAGQNAHADSLKMQLHQTMYDTLRVRMMTDIGLSLYSTQPDSAIKWWKKADHLADSVRHRYSGNNLQRLLTLKGDALSNIGFLYMNMGLSSPALEYNFKALNLRDSISDRHGQAESLNNIAFEYCELGDTAQALGYYERSAVKYQAINDSGGVGYTFINRGRIYAAQKNDSAARRVYLMALQLLHDNEVEHRGYSQSLNNLGTVELRAGNYTKAREYINRGAAIRKEHEDRSGLAGSYISLGKLYDALGFEDSALYWTNLGYETAVACRSSTYRIQGAQRLSSLYNERGEYQKALQYYKIYILVRDSVANEESGKTMVRKQMGYDYAQKSAADSLNFVKEKELGEVKLSRQRGYTIGGFSALAVVALLLFFVYRQRNRISLEKKRSEELLLNILPAETAEELKQTGTAKTKKYETVSVMFTDFKNFTQTAEQLSPEDLVQLINFCYAEFDRIVTKHHVEKIKTIGDSYMCVGGLPMVNSTHAVDTVSAAREMLSFITAHNNERRSAGLPYFDIRIGIHTGPVVAGIVGIKKFAYDIWGDTVNLASRMESSGEPGRINISSSTFELVQTKFTCTHRGKIQAKNKGEIDMYFVE